MRGARNNQIVQKVSNHLLLSAVGCFDLQPPQGTHMTRNGDDVIVTCLFNDHTWRLRCSDGRWQGVIGNCTQCRRETSCGNNQWRDVTIAYYLLDEALLSAKLQRERHGQGIGGRGLSRWTRALLSHFGQPV